MKPIALHCSDVHVRHGRPDEKYALSQIVDAAIAQRVDVVAAGDLIDKQSNRADAITFFYRQLDRLRAAGRKWYYTQGQHDFDDPPWLSAHPAAVHMHKKALQFSDDGLVMYGLDWQPYGRLQDELAEVPRHCTLLVCHQVWADWMGGEAGPQGSFAQVPAHVTHVHTGDLHMWKLERHANAGGKRALVLSTGAVAQQNVTEPASHYYALLYPDGRFERRPLKSRVAVDCPPILKQEDAEAFMAALEPLLAESAQRGGAMDLPPEMATPVFRVTYTSRMPDVAARVEKAVAGRARLAFKQLPPPEKEEAYAAAAASAGSDAVTPIALLGEEIDRAEHPDAYALAELMLAPGDKAAAFAKWRAEFLGDGPEPAAD